MSLKVWALSRGIHYETSGIVKLFDTLDKAKLAAETIAASDSSNGEWVLDSYNNTHTWENEEGWISVTQWDVE